MRVISAWVLALAVAFAFAVPGCFHPDKPSCAFSCGEGARTCPAGYTCGSDNLCHNPNSTAVCLIELIDASALETAPDAGSDLLPD
jgi:hypothetical protein